jgi:hypothetical protein
MSRVNKLKLTVVSGMVSVPLISRPDYGDRDHS